MYHIISYSAKCIHYVGINQCIARSFCGSTAAGRTATRLITHCVAGLFPFVFLQNAGVAAVHPKAVPDADAAVGFVVAAVLAKGCQPIFMAEIQRVNRP